MQSTEQRDQVKHYLAHATRQELLHEFASRNLCTVVLFDCMIATSPGKVEPMTMSQTFGPVTQVHGLLTLHAEALQVKIANSIHKNYGNVPVDGLEGT
jgi:hypothetical protein